MPGGSFQEIQMGSFSIWHWLIVLVIVMLVFGTKKMRNIGQDLGGAVKGFKTACAKPKATAKRRSPMVANRRSTRSPGQEQVLIPGPQPARKGRYPAAPFRFWCRLSGLF